MKVISAIRDIVKPNWREGNGRPSKEQLVKQWRIHNPEGKKIDCHRDTGIDPKTIRKWWNYEDSDNAEMIQLTKSVLMQLRCIESELRRQGLTEIESNQELEKQLSKNMAVKRCRLCATIYRWWLWILWRWYMERWENQDIILYKLLK